MTVIGVADCVAKTKPSLKRRFIAPVMAQSSLQSTVNTLPDLIPPESDRKNPAGNHILINCKGADVILAHLQQGSITVQAGNAVKVGQAIAKVGNSGNTIEPHLHIHARKENTGKSILNGEGMPIIFDSRFLVRNSLFTVRG